MCEILYYLSCFGCFGLCCEQRYVKKNNKEDKSRTLKHLKAITPPDSGIKRMTSSPISLKTKDMTDIYEIPNEEFRTEKEVIASYGYSVGKEIGEGACALVFKAKHVNSNFDIAVKIAQIPEDVDKYSKKQRMKALKTVKRELFVLEEIRHPHIIQMIEHFLIVQNKTAKLYLFMQYAQHGDLSVLLRSKGPFDEETCKQWFAQMLSALVYMHNKSIAHRDLKLSNILLDSSDDILVSDFGFSQVVTHKISGQQTESKTYCGTPPYMAPEILEKKENPRKFMSKTYDPFLVDVWSLAVILFILLNISYPFGDVKATNPIGKAVQKMKERKWRFTERMVEPPTLELDFLLKKMFEPEPQLRPKMSELTQYLWISDVYKTVEHNCKQWIEMKNKSNV